jgi:hypothetical protein
MVRAEAAAAPAGLGVEQNAGRPVKKLTYKQILTL